MGGVCSRQGSSQRVLPAAGEANGTLLQDEVIKTKSTQGKGDKEEEDVRKNSKTDGEEREGEPGEGVENDEEEEPDAEKDSAEKKPPVPFVCTVEKVASVKAYDAKDTYDTAHDLNIVPSSDSESSLNGDDDDDDEEEEEE